MKNKFPIRYFNGSSLEIFPTQLLDGGLKFFEETIAYRGALTGETGIDGLLIDFNDGLRLQIPSGNWHVRISDGASDMIFFDEDISSTLLISKEKFFVEWEIALWLDGEPVFYHRFDPRGQSIHFWFGRAMGDNIALLPYVEQFRQKFECRTTCTVPTYMREIVEKYYPHLEPTKDIPDDSYACFYMAAWSNVRRKKFLRRRRRVRSSKNTSVLPCKPRGRINVGSTPTVGITLSII